ncbi:MAG: L-rhamnose isomerase [Clostridiaceae bacterium]|nr:L-rhamnose isomerase [Clostridiaceae bacterium]
MKKVKTRAEILKGYEYAREAYAAYGVDTDKVLEDMRKRQVSIHCWQGDDVHGFEVSAMGASGGILSTGDYPGRARTGDELRADYEKALSLIPGKHRINLHAIYAETGGEIVERDAIKTDHFSKWIDWAKKLDVAIDFNPTCFSHPMAASGFTLGSKDEKVRSFWIDHVKACRKIAADIGRELGKTCIMNIWVPDGMKDIPSDRIGYRALLKKSLDEIFEVKYDRKYLIDAFESKLFGIGLESYTAGSHEFVMSYALKNDITMTFDMGHFHLTESVADKISSALLFADDLLLHVSRPVRWDSDHVVIYNDELVAVAQEIKRCNAFDRVYYGLDFFDGSINRITAWVSGTRAALKSILFAMLEPTELLVEEENKGNYGNRMALMEEFKALPLGAVWDKYCLDMNTPAGADWLEDVKEYEERVLAAR